MKIQNYQQFNRKHKKYSRNVHFNMYRHGYFCVQEVSIPITNGKAEKSIDIVQEYAEFVGNKDSDFVYYRVKDGWGLPYIFIFQRIN